MQKTAYTIVKKLQDAGFVAYFVGGCVRDILLKKIPLDYDVATNALPEQIETLFDQTYAVGKQFGVINIIENNHHFEIATFRSDAGYSDGRRPDAIFFADAEADSQRRDFTINGIFYDPVTHEYLDFVGGLRDLRRGLLRFIGDPDQRIQEDYLRILRAIRFKNRFHLTYETQTYQALQKQAALVLAVSAERIQAELNKILLDNHRYEALIDLDDLELGTKILPEVWSCQDTPQPSDHHAEGSVFEHLLLVVKNMRLGSNLVAIWAALLHDIGKKDTLLRSADRFHYPNHHQVSVSKAKLIAKRLKFSKKMEQKMSWLIEHHHVFDSWADMKRSTQLHYFDHPQFADLLELHRADILGSQSLNQADHQPLLQEIKTIEQDFFDALSQQQTPKTIQPFLNGTQIMEILSIPPSEKIKHLKKIILEAQIHQKIKTYTEAVAFIKKISF